MTYYCAHCCKSYPREHFSVKRREKRRLWNGPRVLSMTHLKSARGCGGETEYPDGGSIRNTQRAGVEVN